MYAAAPCVAQGYALIVFLKAFFSEFRMGNFLNAGKEVHFVKTPETQLLEGMIGEPNDVKCLGRVLALGKPSEQIMH